LASCLGVGGPKRHVEKKKTKSLADLPFLTSLAELVDFMSVDKTPDI
jgi:hypothetical protein